MVNENSHIIRKDEMMPIQILGEWIAYPNPSRPALVVLGTVRSWSLRKKRLIYETPQNQEGQWPIDRKGRMSGVGLREAQRLVLIRGEVEWEAEGTVAERGDILAIRQVYSLELPETWELIRHEVPLGTPVPNRRGWNTIQSPPHQIVYGRRGTLLKTGIVHGRNRMA